MKKITLCVLVLALMAIIPIYAQEMPVLTSKDSIVESSWIIGLGYNIVDDSGDVFDELLSVDSQWNVLPYPSRLSIGKYFKNGIGLEAIGSFNTYKEGKIIDGAVNTEKNNYFSVDSRVTYDLNKLIGQTAWFDPYVGGGIGFTDANDQHRATYNAVVGFRTWISDTWGLDFSSTGKWAIGDNGATNHIQHAAGVVYQFGVEKGLSKKGAEKLALINAMEKERQRVQDSIAAADRAREDTALAERLAKEKEQARLAAAEQAKIEAENARKRQIEQKIEALGYVYFDLNSSYLGKQSKAVLDSLSTILSETVDLQLEITSHTDSRGSSEYNKWLSERRVKNTMEYLVKKGIEADRLSSKAFGEDNLLNECSDGVRCSEEKHKINRRSEFKALFK
ncbi:OmpA family protein [Maribacter halichondriae]|uniref:OmpA family protein n=1 Tax=Maribacter halichondriae TaxID=2980554 RepID=UPI002358D3DF|nr:OmpA family protein [Maribacter sp. Hal144]